MAYFPYFFITSQSSSLASKDLEITNFDTRVDGKEMVVTGMISNLAESDDYIGSDIHSKANENFEVRFRYLPEAVLAGKATIKLKVAGGVSLR